MNTQVGTPASVAKLRITTSTKPCAEQRTDPKHEHRENGYRHWILAVTSISIFMRASTSPQTIAVAAGRAVAKY